jgi:hypothetical protein
VETSEKALDGRLRRKAERAGYRLVRCRSRNPEAQGYGTYYIIDDGGAVCAGDVLRFGLTMQDVGEWLKSPVPSGR